jgi:hypothetical protein
MIETIKKLKSVPTGKWFSVITSAGDVTEIVKELIDSNEQFIFSDNMNQFKRISEWKLNIPYGFITDHECHFNPYGGSMYQL